MTDIAAIETRLKAREARLAWWRVMWWDGPRDLPYRALCVAWAIATLARCTLMEVAQPGWWIATGLLVLGSAQLVWRGGRVGWLLSLIGLVVPLWFFGDWLTQSVVLSLVAAVGTLTVRGDGLQGSGATEHPVRVTAHVLVACTYLVAAFHKLNAGFVDPSASCANHGWRQLGSALVFDLPLPDALAAILPFAVLSTEVVVGILIALRSRWAIPLAAALHVPFTLALAPAFAFVMALGWVAATPDEVLTEVWRAWRERWRRCAADITIIAGVTLAVTEGLDVVMAVKIALLVDFAVLLNPVRWSAAVRASAATAKVGNAASRASTRGPRNGRMWGAAAVAVFVLNGGTPYLGTQMQHTGAMLSNLRIDTECANHLIVPSTLRIVDPYVRIDRASMGSEAAGTVGAWREREETLRSLLWSTTALWSMRRNWCTDGTRPIRLEGTFRGDALVIDDLCDEATPLPRGPGVFGGDGVFDGYLRLQKNLPRSCMMSCVH